MKEHTLDILTAALIKYGTRVFWAAVIVFVGLRIIRIARRAAGQIMDRAGVEITLKKFLDMLLHAVLFGVMVFMAADQLGIKTTSFVAVIGTVTLAFSLAMQNTLSNFAGGTLILLLKPFKVGDYISTSSGEGTVESIGLVYTTLLTTDNRVITIPNSSVSSAPLTNLTRTGKRRLIINVGIGYSSDLLTLLPHRPLPQPQNRRRRYWSDHCKSHCAGTWWKYFCGKCKRLRNSWLPRKHCP